MNQRLYRSADDRILAGVAGGMAETYDLDPALVRVGWALLILVSGGLFLLLYIVMAIVVPPRPQGVAFPWSPASAGAAPTGGTSSVPPGPGGEMPGAGTPGPGPGPAYEPWRYGRHRRDGSGALVIGLILLLVGAFLLARQYLPNFEWNLLWPLGVIAVGAVLIIAAFARPGAAR